MRRLSIGCLCACFAILAASNGSPRKKKRSSRIRRIKTLLSGDVDYLYSVGTIIAGAVLGLPVKTLSFDFAKVMHFLMARPEITAAAMLKGKRVGVSSFGGRSQCHNTA